MGTPRRLDRRAFLQSSLGLGATLAGGAFLLGGCDSSGPSPATSTTPATLGPPTPRDWRGLRASLTGTLVLESDTAWQLDRLLYNSKFDPRPTAIAYCATPDDVARCLAFATARDLAFAARSGGHSYGGYSSTPGLVIDVSPMSKVSVDVRSSTAVVGAGARLIDAYDVIGNHGRLLPGGSCATVGIAGLALGGGVGVFGRKFGLTSDNIRSIRLVTSDSRIVTADASDHADLLWASQGGGGGNFAVVTSFEFRVHEMPEVTLFTLQYPWGAASDLVEAWQRWMQPASDELWSNCQLYSQGTVGFLAQTGGVFCGSARELEPMLTRLKRSMGTAPSAQFIGTNDYIDAMKVEAGCSGLTIASCHLSPEGSLSRSAYSAKSSYVKAPITSGQATNYVAAVEVLARAAPTVGGALSFDAYGGAINRVASDATAFVHRDALACIQATYSWSGYTPSSEIAAGARWLAWLGRDVFDATTGAYQNYIDPTLANWQRAYYGANLERLAEVKRRYDPEDFFAFAQSIPVSA